MRVHLLSTPNVQTTKAAYLDGFAQRTILFAETLKALGHTVILYASEENDAPCDSHVKVLSKAEQTALSGGLPYQYVTWEADQPIAKAFNARVAAHIRSVKQPGDLIASIGGGQFIIAEAHPELKWLEYSVGYQGVGPLSHRIYQSAAWRHVVYGFSGVTGNRELDDVIPPWFHVSEFPFVAHPDPYVVFCGRLVHSKGILTACEAAQRANVSLIVIGHGEQSLVTYGQYVGAIDVHDRNQLLANATACLMPTQYIEPFGNVAAEAQLCGTPVISTDFGGFVESVEHGKTGYRCKTIGEFVQAIGLAKDLDRRYIRTRAQALYGFDAGLESYRRYFERFTAADGFRDLAPGLSGVREEVAA